MVRGSIAHDMKNIKNIAHDDESMHGNMARIIFRRSIAHDIKNIAHDDDMYAISYFKCYEIIFVALVK